MSVPLYQAKAELFRTLGHPVRIRVLELLQDGPKPVRDLLAADRRRGVQPVAAAGRAAPRRDGHLAPRRLAGHVRAQHRPTWPTCWPPGGASWRGAHRPGRPARRAARRADGPSRWHDACRPPRWRRRGVAGRGCSGCCPAGPTGRRCAARPRRDLLAGLTVAVVALPLALASASPPGSAPQAGLATAVVAGALAAVFGGSNLQVSGPTGAMTVVLVPIVQQFGADRRADGRGDGRAGADRARAGPRSAGTCATCPPRWSRASPPASPW